MSELNNSLTHNSLDKSDPLQSPLVVEAHVRNAFDWEAAQLALDSDSFELDAASLPRGSSVCVHVCRGRLFTHAFAFRIQVAILLARLSHMFTVAPPRALLASPSTSRLEVAWTCSSIWWAKLPLDGPGSLPAAAPHPRVTRPTADGVGHGSSVVPAVFRRH